MKSFPLVIQSYSNWLNQWQNSSKRWVLRGFKELSGKPGMYPVKPTGEHLRINLCLVLFAQLELNFDQYCNIMATFNGSIQSFPNSKHPNTKVDDPKMRNSFLWPIHRLAFPVRLFYNEHPSLYHLSPLILFAGLQEAAADPGWRNNKIC